MYIIISGNEPNADIFARADAELYMAYIRASKNPKQTYEAVMKYLNEEDDSKNMQE